MNENIFFVLLYIVNVAFASFSQVLLKKSAQKQYKSKVYEYVNPLVAISYAIFFGTTIITVLCYNYMNLSTGVIVDSMGYIFVSFFSLMFLKENFSKRKLAGTVFIVLGLIIYSIN